MIQWRESKKGKKVCTKTNKNETTQEVKNCLLPLCGASVIHLPHHLQNVHGWSLEHSRTAVTRFGMRVIPFQALQTFLKRNLKIHR